MAYPPHAKAEDYALFDRARNVFPVNLDWRQISPDQLNEIARVHSIEVATAGWCDAIRNAPEQADFVRAIETAVTGRTSPAIVDLPTIVLIRGAFFRQHRQTGADGDRILRIAREMGWPIELVEIDSFGSLERNADAILNHLLRTQASKLMLVSLSKGSADIAMALNDPRAAAAMERVCGWVSLSGLSTGTPLISWLRSHRLRTIGVHLLLWSRGQRFRVLDQLRHNNGPLASRVTIPAHFRTIHVVGFPVRCHLRHPWAPNGYERIAPLGPTDGGGILLADSARLQGRVYPVWGADHYLQPDWDVEPLIRSILLHAARSDVQPNAIPTTKSNA